MNKIKYFLLICALMTGAVSGLKAQHGTGAGTEPNPWIINMSSTTAASVVAQYSFTAAGVLTITGPGYYEITGTTAVSGSRVIVNYSPPAEVLAGKATRDENLYLATMALQEAFAADPTDEDEHDRLYALVIVARNDLISYLAAHTVHVRLNGVSITNPGANSAFAITGNSIVNMRLTGNNTLEGGLRYAGIWVNYTSPTQIATLIIDESSTGDLTATGGGGDGGGAGIGGNGFPASASCGNIIINGGNITATGGTTTRPNSGGGAGIGGGGAGHRSNPSGGNNYAGIFLMNGTIKSKGGNSEEGCGGAGIGGGAAHSGVNGGLGNQIEVSPFVIVEAEGGEGNNGDGPPIGNGGQALSNADHSIIIARHPQNTSVAQGYIQGVSLDVNAMLRPTGVLRYQWQRLISGVWTDIAAANERIFYLPTDLTVGTYQFRCLLLIPDYFITNNVVVTGPRETNAATVTVTTANKSVDILMGSASIVDQTVQFPSRSVISNQPSLLTLTAYNNGNVPFIQTEDFDTRLEASFTDIYLNETTPTDNFLATPLVVGNLFAGNSLNFTLNTLPPSNNLVVGTYTAKVTLTGRGANSDFSVSFNVRFVVTQYQIDEFVAILKEPKLNYFEGETFSLDGFKVEVKYKDEYDEDQLAEVEFGTDEYVDFGIQTNIVVPPSTNINDGDLIHRHYHNCWLTVDYDMTVGMQIGQLSVIPTNTVTITSEADNSSHSAIYEGAPVPISRYPAGATVTIYAGTVPGKTFTRWEVTSSNATLSYPDNTDWSTAQFTMPNADVAIEAIFDLVPYTFILEVVGKGTVTGTIGGDDILVIPFTKADANASMIISLTAAADPNTVGSEFKYWEVTSTLGADLVAEPTEEFIELNMPPHHFFLRAVFSNWEITLEDDGDQLGNDFIYDFGEATFGYEDGDVEPFIVTIKNTGNEDAADLTITLDGDVDAFEVTPFEIDEIVVDDYATFTIKVAEDLDVGEYAATVTVSGANDIEASFDVTFVVEPKPITDAVVNVIEIFTYNGTAQNITATDITVTLDGTPLEPVTDYTVTSDGGVNAGTTYTFTVTGIGNYSGTLSGIQWTIIKAASPQGVEEIQLVVINHPLVYPFTLSTLLPTLASPMQFGPTVTYVPVITNNDDGVIDASFNYTGGGTLNIPTQNVADEGKLAMITVTISSTNFENFESTIKVETVEKEWVDIEITMNTDDYDFIFNGNPWGVGDHYIYEIYDIDGIEITTIGAANVVASYRREDGTALSGAPVNAGNYVLVLNIVDHPVYIGEGSADFTINKTPVNIAAIAGVIPPEPGVAPVSNFTQTEQHSGTLVWSPSHNPFRHYTEYTATITLADTENYTLDGVTANFFTVAGAATTTNAANSGVVTAVFAAIEEDPDTEFAVLFMLDANTMWDVRVVPQSDPYVRIPVESPTLDGFEFGGWFEEGKITPWLYSQEVTQTIEVFARWIDISSFDDPVTVTFMEDEESIWDVQVVERGTPVTVPVPSPVREGYYVTGWHQNLAGAAWNFDNNVTYDMILYARWEPVPPGYVNVTFIAEGGSPTMSSQTVLVNTPVLPPVPYPVLANHYIE